MTICVCLSSWEVPVSCQVKHSALCVSHVTHTCKECVAVQYHTASSSLTEEPLVFASTNTSGFLWEKGTRGVQSQLKVSTGPSSCDGHMKQRCTQTFSPPFSDTKPSHYLNFWTKSRKTVFHPSLLAQTSFSLRLRDGSEKKKKKRKSNHCDIFPGLHTAATISCFQHI